MPSTLELIDIDALLDEIERYLAAVDLFRAEGHEPHWGEDE